MFLERMHSNQQTLPQQVSSSAECVSNSIVSVTFGFQTGSGNLTAPSFGIKSSTEGDGVKPTTSTITFGFKSSEPSVPSTTPAIPVTQPISDVRAASDPRKYMKNCFTEQGYQPSFLEMRGNV